MEINSSIVFQKNWEALNSDTRFIVNQGSSRSSKTYSICQCLIVYALTNQNKVISVIRKSMPSLRATAMRDFFDILQELNIYDRNAHNKTENIYTFNTGTIVEFFSADEEQKLRGRSRDIAWLNEANELFYDDFNQINLRSREHIIFDYNPSDANSFIYELPEDEKILIQSTYKDNPFLEDSIIKQIENLQYTDEALWSIYGLGVRATSRKNIYNSWTFLDHKPLDMAKYVYGLDFGFNHPTSLVRVWYNLKNEIYIESLIYQSYLTTTDLIGLMDSYGIDKHTEIMADYSRPEIIHEIRNAGYYILDANKSVKKGLDNVKTFKVYAQNDKNIIKEYENYMYKKIGDILTDEPTKAFDDIMDATRYAVYQIKTVYTTITPFISF